LNTKVHLGQPMKNSTTAGALTVNSFGKKSRPAMYDATPIAYEDYSPDDKPLVTLIKTKDL